MEWAAAIGAALTVVAIILNHFWKQKTRAEKVKEAASSSLDDIQRFKRKLANGDLNGTMDEMDLVESRLRMLLRLHEKGRPRGS